jgi:acetyl esterase/lipase
MTISGFGGVKGTSHGSGRLDCVNGHLLESGMTIPNRSPRSIAVAALLALPLMSCSRDPVQTGGEIVAGVDLDALFAPATAGEIASVQAEWGTRAAGAVGVDVMEDTVVAQSGLDLRVRLVSHVVDDLRHVGAVISGSAAAGPRPVIVYAHGGDEGVSVEDVLFLCSLLGADAARFIWVVPSFRSEPLRFLGKTWSSQGGPSPWDRDVDDALALLDAAVSIEPAVDEANVAVLGFSRGAGVALLMGVRDPRITRIVDFFGPTDFLGPFVRTVARESLLGDPRDLPGLTYLDETFLQPLARGETSMAKVRLELVRRSAVLWAERLPMVQLHHGDADPIVEVSQAESLIAAMTANGRAEPDFQAYLYPGGAHNPLTLPGSIDRAVVFLRALLPAPLVH